MQPLFTVNSARIRCVRSFFISSSCYVTAPLAMYIKSETRSVHFLLLLCTGSCASLHIF